MLCQADLAGRQDHHPPACCGLGIARPVGAALAIAVGKQIRGITGLLGVDLRQLVQNQRGIVVQHRHAFQPVGRAAPFACVFGRTHDAGSNAQRGGLTTAATADDVEAPAGGSGEPQQRPGEHRGHCQHQPGIAPAPAAHLAPPVGQRAHGGVVVLQTAAVLIDQQFFTAAVALATGQHVAAAMPARHGYIAGAGVDALLNDVGQQPLHRVAMGRHLHTACGQLAHELTWVAPAFQQGR